MAALVSLIGGVVILGWVFEVFDIYLYTAIMPHLIGMRFTTALSFLLSGLVLLLIANAHQHHSAQSGNLLPAASMGLLLLMVGMLIISVMDIQTNVEYWFVGDAAYALKADVSGLPSIGTMSAFIVIGLIGVLTLINPPKSTQLLLAGFIECGFAIIALFGYLLNIPLLCYEIEGTCSAMSLHAAILFIVLGIGLLILGSIKK